MTASTRSEVLAYLAEFTQTPELAHATGDVDLQQAGIDSFGMLEFILGLEKRFGITIDDQHFDVRLFLTVESIASFIDSLRSAT